MKLLQSNKFLLILVGILAGGLPGNASAQIAYAVGGMTDSTGTYGRIVKTTDGGINWAFTGNFEEDFLYAIHFVNENVGYASGYNGAIIKTTDGGITWAVQNDSMPNVILSDIHFYDENTGGAVGSAGALLTTTDGGQNWIQRDLGIGHYLFFIRYVSPTTAYLGVDINSGWIYKTEDGGETWEIDPNFAPAKYRVGEFVSANTGFIYGFNQTGGTLNRYLYKTTDGGQNWSESQIANPEVSIIINIEFVNDTLGYFANYAIWNNQFYRSTDGGQTWAVDLSAPPSLFDYKFFNPASAIAFQPDYYPVKNRFFYTNDGGFTWNEAAVLDSALYIRDLFVLLEQPTGPALYQPAPNAVVSVETIEFDWNDIFKPRFYQIQIARDAAFSNLVYQSNMVASTFTLENAGLDAGSNYYWRVRGINHGSISGEWSEARSFTTEGLTGLEPLNAGAPKEFKLFDNFPNPFNPETVIKYQLPQSSPVRLEVYNNLGQKVRTLINQRQEAGYYRAVWDGRNDLGAAVASGVYIYRFRAGDFLQVKKMILLR
jgi:photosystem II stability/assembly factor-like uncharacterized protein